MKVTKCQYCKKVFFETYSSICPFCKKNLKDSILEDFKNLFGLNKPFNQTMG